MTCYEGANVTCFAVPLHKRIFLEAQDAYSIVNQILVYENNQDEFSFLDVLEKTGETVSEQNPVVMRLLLASSRNYRRYRAANGESQTNAEFYSELRCPKFIWVAEFSTYDAYKQGKAYGEIVIDATAARHEENTNSIIMIRYLSHVGVRCPGGTFEELNNMLSKKMKGMSDNFLIYKNNLKQIENNL